MTVFHHVHYIASYNRALLLICQAVGRSQEEANRIIAKSQAEIENQKQEAITDLKNQVADLSVQLAEVLLKDSLTEEQKQKALNHSLIKEFGSN